MKLGQRGEIAACDYLRKKGFRILAKNYRLSFGEIDIVAKKGGTLIFCEVKTRTKLSWGEPFEAVDLVKRKRLRMLAEGFIAKEKPTFKSVRFDVISIKTVEGRMELKHLENAFI